MATAESEAQAWADAYEASHFLDEAFVEVLAGLDKHDRADLARAILSEHDLDWSRRIGKDLRDYLWDAMNDIRRGYRE